MNSTAHPSINVSTRIIGFILPPAISGVLTALAFPPYNLWWLAWIGLTPLLAFIYGKKPAYGFLSFLVFTYVFFSIVFVWVFKTSGYNLLHHFILGILLGVPLGVFGLLFCILSRRFQPFWVWVTAPFIWIVIEYIRSNQFFLSLPWGLLGHTQHLHPAVIQVCSITGVYGLSFVIFYVNCTVAAGLLFLLKRQHFAGFHGGTSPGRDVVLISGTALALTVATLAYGHMSLNTENDSETIRVSVLQGNIDQNIKWNPKYAGFIMKTYGELSESAAKEKPDLIVWPEAATPGLILTNKNLRQYIVSIVTAGNTHFLIGSSERSKFFGKANRNRNVGNTALFFSPEGEVLGHYLKIRLVPFGEHLPHGETIPWPDFLAPKRTMQLPGNEYTLFDLNGFKFGSLICWETIFPDLFRRFVRDGADFMLNITNEGWFPETAISHQYLSMNVFRAVENRVSLARAANTGVSCFIDPFGRITGKVQQGDQDVLVRGFLTQNMPILKEKTIYTKYGDVFAYVCILVAVIMVVWALIKTKHS